MTDKGGAGSTGSGAPGSPYDMTTADKMALLGGMMAGLGGVSSGPQTAAALVDYRHKSRQAQAQAAARKALVGAMGGPGAGMDAVANADAAGVDVAPYLDMAAQARKQQERAAFLASVPPADQAWAATDPEGYLKARHPGAQKVGNKLVDPASGQVLYDGGPDASGLPTGYVPGPDGAPMLAPWYLKGERSLADTRRQAIVSRPMPKAAGAAGLPPGFVLDH